MTPQRVRRLSAYSLIDRENGKLWGYLGAMTLYQKKEGAWADFKEMGHKKEAGDAVVKVNLSYRLPTKRKRA